jgi:hypothetical protein
MDKYWLHTRNQKYWKHIKCGGQSTPPDWCRNCRERTDGELWQTKHNFEYWNRSINNEGED